MTRFQRLTSTMSLVAFVAAGAAFVMPTHTTPSSAARASRAAGTTIFDVAQQLGVTVASVYEGQDFAYGSQFTGSLKDPAKLAALGLDGFHPGARVVAAWIGPSVVFVEADEQDPQQKANVRLRIGDDGRLSKM